MTDINEFAISLPLSPSLSAAQSTAGVTGGQYLCELSDCILKFQRLINEQTFRLWSGLFNYESGHNVLSKPSKLYIHTHKDSSVETKPGKFSHFIKNQP